MISLTYLSFKRNVALVLMQRYIKLNSTFKVMIEHKGTSMVCFNKSKLTKKEIMYIKTPLEGIQIVENGINISVHDPEHKHPEFMSRMVDLLYKTAKR